MSDQPWDALISSGRVAELYHEGMRRWPEGEQSSSQPGCLERSLGAAWSAELYDPSDDGTRGLIFAGNLLFLLVQNHCYIDGNKRLGWLSCMHVLLQLGLTVDATDDDAYDMIMAFIGRKLDAAAVVRWIADRLVAAPFAAG